MTDRRTLPARYYTDPVLFARERERVFASMWVCAGRTEEISAPGEFVVREVAGESLIVTRRKDGVLAAHFNVCRHRGTRLCTEETGRFAERIQCPYHGWTYGLDGRLLGAPHMDGVAGFRREDNGLSPVAVADWQGHLFVTLNPSPEPLHAQLNGLTERFAPWHMSELRRGYRVVYDVRANWKLVMLNYSECLHCPLIHPALQRNTDYLSGDNEPPTDTWFGGAMTFREGVFTMNRDGRQRRSPLPGLNDQQQRQGYYYAVLPNLLLSPHPDYVMTHTLWPVACDHTRIVCEWHFHPSEHANPLFDPSDVIDFWDEVNRQDWHVSELSQQGISSRAYRPGLYSPREGLLWDFDQAMTRLLDAGAAS
jgi:phenylpropionate dioxygenase-like ring-hydroxylating dioxygenase large terminal subunit